VESKIKTPTRGACLWRYLIISSPSCTKVRSLLGRISRLSRQEADGAAVTFERLHTMANISPFADLDTVAGSRETLCPTDVAIDRVRRQLLSMLDRLDKGEPVDSGLARYTCEPK
jgi:hypothetical protein